MHVKTFCLQKVETEEYMLYGFSEGGNTDFSMEEVAKFDVVCFKIMFSNAWSESSLARLVGNLFFV